MIAKCITAVVLASSLLVVSVHAQFPLPKPRPVLGTFQAGRYHHNLTGVEFTVPPDWSIIGDDSAEDGLQMVGLTDFKSWPPNAAVWLKPHDVAAADIPKLLHQQMDLKVRKRIAFDKYTIRPESIQTRVIAGQQALTAVADWVDHVPQSAAVPDGEKKMVEYLTWVFSQKTYVFVAARIPSSDLATFRRHFDQIFAAAVIP